MPLKRSRQTTLFEFTSSPSRSPMKHSSPIKGNIEVNSDDDDEDSDPGRIKFERDVIVVQDSDKSHSDADEADEKHASSRRSARIQMKQRQPAITTSSSHSASTEGEVAPPSSRNKRFRHGVVNSDGSESESNKKRRKLVKGKRPETTLPSEEEEDLVEEVDEDRILDSRLRDRSQKSAFARNLERLQRRRRGHMSASESENDDEDDHDNFESPSSAHAGSLTPFKGARPNVISLDEDEDGEGNGSVNENEDDFIVQDDGGEEVPELPTMFSMGTFQDLSHHFKVICQLFVHLAVKRPHKRGAFMKDEMQKTYFSVPLSIARRKLSGMRDSLVASSVWKPDFKKPLETLPDFQLERLDFAIPLCDACHLGNRVATIRGVIGGQSYDLLTYEPLVGVGAKNNDQESNQIEWNLGRFCAARTQVFHIFTHWEYTLYHALRKEVEDLRTTFSETSNGKERRVFLPATHGPSPPDDLDDADGIMDWLDGRGIINMQWVRMKEMMDRARKLEARGKDAEDEIEIG